MRWCSLALAPGQDATLFREAFWKWTEFGDYLLFLGLFTFVVSALVYLAQGERLVWHHWARACVDVCVDVCVRERGRGGGSYRGTICLCYSDAISCFACVTNSYARVLIIY